MKKGRLQLQPGIVKGDSLLAMGDRYVDADKVRFQGGYPERVGGSVKRNKVGHEFAGYASAIFAWDDFAFNPYIAIGTSQRLYVYDTVGNKTDITPLEQSGTLTNPFATTSGSTTVVVTDTAHGRSDGDTVRFSGASAVGGITINGTYIVGTIIDANSYQITHSVAASGTATGGGTVSFEYDLSPGLTVTITGGGYGVGGYGEGTWGTARVGGTYVQLPRVWSLDNYGQYLLALPSGGTLYQWTLTGKAAAVANAPSGQFMFVTPERHVVVGGIVGGLMTLKWCDQFDITVWTASATNSANERQLQYGSRLVGGAALAQRISMLWSDTSAYLMQYTGSKFIYETRRIGDKCGLCGPKAFSVAGQVAYWMGNSTFWNSSGSSVGEMPNTQDIKDYVFDNIADPHRVVSGHNPKFNEIWWLYKDFSNVWRSVFYSIDAGIWTIGTKARTAWCIQATKKDRVLCCDENGNYLEEDTGDTDNGAPINWYLETGFSDIDQGNQRFDVWGYYPDWARLAAPVQIVITTKDYSPDPADEDTETETIEVTTGTEDLKLSGRQVKLRLSGTGDFRMGVPRLELGQAGEKR